MIRSGSQQSVGGKKRERWETDFFWVQHSKAVREEKVTLFRKLKERRKRKRSCSVDSCVKRESKRANFQVWKAGKRVK